MEQTESNTRTRINLSQTAKGYVTFDITAEYDTPERSIEMLGRAVELTRAMIREKGMRAADEVV